MKKILVIEDNPDVRDNIQEILELANYDVITADDGQQGIEKAKFEKPALIVCDIMMPKLDGYEVLHMLSNNPDTASIPFIFLTAKVDKSDWRKGMNLGADDYLLKPFGKMDLLEAIEGRFKRNALLKKNYSSDEEGLNAFINEVSALTELKQLTKDRKNRTYKKKDTIYREGDSAGFLYFIKKGKVKLVKTDNYGKDLVTVLLNEGDFFGHLSLLESNEYLENAIAIEETELALIPDVDFKTLIFSNRDVAHKFIKILAKDVKENEDRLLRMAFGTIRERLADALLKLYTKDANEVMSVKITRENLAGIVGTVPESLIRTLSEFKEADLIEINGREIVLKDEHRIKQMAGIRG